MRARALLLFLLLTAAPAAGAGEAAGTAPVYLFPDGIETLMFGETTPLYAVYTRDPNPGRITRESLPGLLNDRFPGDAGRFAPFLATTGGVTLALKHERGTFEAEFLADFGRGLSDDDRANLNGATGILVCGATGDPRKGEARDAAARIAWAVARETAGTLFDVATLECFGAEAFRAARLSAEGPAARREVLVRIGRDAEGRLRLATRGMRKFGRPDLALEHLANEDVDPGTHLLRALAYRLSSADLGPRAGTSIILSGADLVAMLEPGAVTASPIVESRTFEIRLLAHTPGPWDDANRIVRVVGVDGSTAAALAGVKSVFDVGRARTDLFDSGLLMRESAALRAEIPGILDRFPFPDGSELYLLVNPEPYPDPTALVWIKVVARQSPDTVVGIVQPNQVSLAVSAGDHLTVPLARAYDWSAMKDGRVVGGDTLRVKLFGKGR